MEEEEIMNVKGRNLENGIPKIVQINSNQVLDAIHDSLYEIITSTKEVLEKCPPELAADILDNGIIITGGGSLIKNFATLLEKEVRIKVILSEEPLNSVVLGGGKAFDSKNLLRTLQVREY